MQYISVMTQHKMLSGFMSLAFYAKHPPASVLRMLAHYITDISILNVGGQYRNGLVPVNG